MPALVMLRFLMSRPSRKERLSGNLHEKDGGKDVGDGLEEGAKRLGGAEEETADEVKDIFNLSNRPVQLPLRPPRLPQQSKAYGALPVQEPPSSPSGSSCSSCSSCSSSSSSPPLALTRSPALAPLPHLPPSFSSTSWSVPAAPYSHPESSSSLSSSTSSSTSSAPFSLAAYAKPFPSPPSYPGLLPSLKSLLSGGGGGGGGGGEDKCGRKGGKGDRRETEGEKRGT